MVLAIAVPSLTTRPSPSRPACAWRSDIWPQMARWAPGMMGTSWGMSPFMRKRRTARRRMDCSPAPAPAPGHQARRASGGKRLGSLASHHSQRHWEDSWALVPREGPSRHDWAQWTGLSCWRDIHEAGVYFYRALDTCSPTPGSLGGGGAGYLGSG